MSCVGANWLCECGWWPGLGPASGRTIDLEPPHWPLRGPGPHQSVSGGAQATTPRTQQVHPHHHHPDHPGGGCGLSHPSELPCEAVTVRLVSSLQVPGASCMLPPNRRQDRDSKSDSKVDRDSTRPQAWSSRRKKVKITKWN